MNKQKDKKSNETLPLFHSKDLRTLSKIPRIWQGILFLLVSAAPRGHLHVRVNRRKLQTVCLIELQ